MREVIARLLWVGNARDGHNVSGILRKRIKAVVDLAMEEPPILFPRDIVYARLPLLDGVGNNTAIIRAAVSTTAALIAGRVPTLVTCGGGMSRSPAIAAAALACARGQPIDEALLDLATHGPHDVTPGLWAEIQSALG